MPGFTCATCGAHHDELPLCFIAPEPAHVASIPHAERASRVLSSSDQCVIDGKHFFILGNLDVPIIGRTETLRWSVWSSLSQKSFERACDLWETAGRETEPPYFGWLCNGIPGYEHAMNLRLEVHTQPVGTRPLLRLQEQDHPLYRDQVEGVSWERACALSHAAS